MVMTLVASRVILGWGWRAAYIALAAPMVLVVIPLVIVLVRSRPPGMQKLSVADASEVLEGFETYEAVRTRSFWMIVLANFCFAFTAAGAAIHMVAYLQGIGYSAGIAALAMSLLFGFAAIGKVVMGFVADRVTARIALAIDFALQAVGLALAFGVGSGYVMFIFVPLFGLTFAAPLMLLPLLVAESLGIKRYGVLGAMAGISQTFGAMVGPIVAGRIFDVTKSYSAAFELFIVVLIAGVGIAYACRPYASERSRMLATPAPASA
jgi:MFS family permease